MKELKVKITFTDDILGSQPKEEEIYREYIASKAPDAANIESEVAALGVDEVVDKGLTVFPKTEDGIQFLYDYQIKGFFKDSCSMLARVGDTKSSKLKAYKKIIDGVIFVTPRVNPITLSAGSKVELCQRPLRAQTAQGERIALSISESIAAGATIEFTVQCLVDDHIDIVREWLDYGKLRGMGQWRNSGKGRFIWEEVA